MSFNSASKTFVAVNSCLSSTVNDHSARKTTFWSKSTT